MFLWYEGRKRMVRLHDVLFCRFIGFGITDGKNGGQYAEGCHGDAAEQENGSIGCKMHYALTENDNIGTGKATQGECCVDHAGGKGRFGVRRINGGNHIVIGKAGSVADSDEENQYPGHDGIACEEKQDQCGGTEEIKPGFRVKAQFVENDAEGNADNKAAQCQHGG